MTEADWIKIAISAMGIFCGVLVALIKELSSRFERLIKSIEVLNINLAILAEKVSFHDRRLERLEEDE